MTTKDLCTVEVRRHFAQPAEAVFDAWLGCDSARQFLFTTPDEAIVDCAIDARVGGKFKIVDRRKNDEGEILNIAHEGEYLEIDRPRRIVFTFGVPMLSPEFTRVELDFTPSTLLDKDGCELHLFHDKVWPEYAEATREGWNAILDGLERVLAS